MYINVLVIFILFVISGFIEFSVFNEEFLLLLCFLAFFVNTYCLMGSSTYQFFTSQISSIRFSSFGAFDAGISQCSTKATVVSSKLGCTWLVETLFKMFTKSLIKYKVNSLSILSQFSSSSLTSRARLFKIFDQKLAVFMLRLTFLT